MQRRGIGVAMCETGYAKSESHVTSCRVNEGIVRLRADDRSPGMRQMGQFCITGSLPSRTETGPRTTTVREIVSLTVTVSVSVDPDTRPANCAGIVGPMAIGYARSK